MDKQEKLEHYIALNRSSPLVVFVLTVLIGPFGMFAVSFKSGIISLLVSLGVGLATAGVGFLVIWLVLPFIGIASAMKHNKNFRLEAELRFNS